MEGGSAASVAAAGGKARPDARAGASEDENDERRLLLAPHTDDSDVDIDGLGADLVRTPRYTPRNRRFVFPLVLGLVLVAAAVAVAVVYFRKDHDDRERHAHDSGASVSPIGFQAAVQTANIVAHLGNLFQHGLGPDGSRSVLGGFNRSAAYVEQQLAGSTPPLRVWRQPLTVPVWRPLAPARLAVGSLGLVENVDFANLRYSGSGNASAAETVLLAGAHAGSPGCNRSAFEPASRFQGRVVVLPDAADAGCELVERALHAEDAGAVGVLFFRTTLPPAGTVALPGGRVRSAEWREGDRQPRIPALGISYTLGLALTAGGGGGSPPSVSFEVHNEVVLASTFNIFAELAKSHPANDVGADGAAGVGDAITERTLVVGAHLDSVSAGPGINDNGSGAMTILEIALMLAAVHAKRAMNVRFAWFGAEELGLLGSRYFVAQLSAEERKHVVAMLNFDMLASPNYVRFVYDSASAPADVQEGCARLQDEFEYFFEDKGVPFSRANFSQTGGSDYFPFLHAGIPAAALATGAGSLKSESERERYGGSANAPYDSCYHQPCDTPFNINAAVLDDMARAAAFTILGVAQGSVI